MTEIKLKETTKRLGDAPLGKLLLSLSLPGIASMTTMALYNIIDTFWVAHLGYRAIAALTVVMPFHVLVIAIGEGTGIGVSALASRRFGEGNIKATNHVAGQIFPLAVLLGSILLTIAVFFSHTILTICGATPDIMDYATQYLVIISFGVPFLIFSISANNLLRGSGEAIRPMIFMIIATVINITLDPLMIFGIGPFPEMGVRGAALATTISQACAAGLNFYYIVAHKSIYRIKLAQIRLQLPILRDIYRVGFPAMIMETTESITFALFTYVISAFGSLAIAAAGLVIRISDLAFMPMFGVAEGLLPIVGFNFGAKLWDRVWRAVKLACIGIALTMGVATVVLEIFTPQAVGIFSDDPELMALAVPAMRITLSSLVILGPTILFGTAFQGLSKGKEALAIALIRQFLFFVPLLLLLPRIWGLNGAWLAWPSSDALAFIVAGLWLFREYKLQQQKNL